MATAALYYRAVTSSSGSSSRHGVARALQQGARRALSSSTEQPRGLSSSSHHKRPRPGAASSSIQQQQQQPLSTHAKRSSDSSSEEYGSRPQQQLARPSSVHSYPTQQPPPLPPHAVHVAPPAGSPVHEVIFVRHGQSTWNRANRFIGWCDTPLTEQGLEEARTAGQILRRHNVKVDEVHTSLLKRSVKTACLILEELGMERVPMLCNWRLNERSYGALVGKNKKECVAEHGAEQVKLWRRSFAVPPPPQDPASKYFPGKDGRKYEALMAQGVAIPLTESLKDVRQRAVQHWEEAVLPSLQAGKRVVLVGHENNLRGLLMHLEGISEAEIPQLEIPRAVPLKYQFDAQMRPIAQPNAAPLLSGAFLMGQREVEALQERDRRQVYDLSIRVNLEEADFRHVISALSGSPSSSSSQPQPSASASASSSASASASTQPPTAVSSKASPPSPSASSSSSINGKGHFPYPPSSSSSTGGMPLAAFSTRAGPPLPLAMTVTGVMDTVRSAWGALMGGGKGDKGRGDDELKVA